MDTFLIEFRGKVQKVSFRDTFYDYFSKKGVVGTIENKEDYVTIRVQNIDRKDLKNLKKILENQNKKIKITKIIIKIYKQEKKFKGLEIKYSNFSNKILSKVHKFIKF